MLADDREHLTMPEILASRIARRGDRRRRERRLWLIVSIAFIMLCCAVALADDGGSIRRHRVTLQWWPLFGWFPIAIRTEQVQAGGVGRCPE